MSKNRVISMYYELKDKDSGELLESNFNVEPIKFITGLGHVLQKLEDEVVGLKDGEERVIYITPSEGVGEYDPNAVKIIEKEQFAGIDLTEGMELLGEGEDGSTARVIVKEIRDNDVVIDFNPPFAGVNMEFKVKVVENRAATKDEIESGVVEGAHSCCCGDHEADDCCQHDKHEHEHKCCGGHH